MATDERPYVLFARTYDSSLRLALKVRAAEEDRSIGEVIENAVRMYLKRPSFAAGKLRRKR